MKKLFYLFMVSLFLFSCKEEIKTENSTSETTEAEIKLPNLEAQLDYFNVSFTTPENWTVDADTLNGMIQIVSPYQEEDLFQEMINVVKGKTSGLELDEFFGRNLAAIQGMFDELVETESPSMVTINNREFKTVKYNYLFEGYPLTANLYVTLTEDASYIINCSALQNTYDNYQEDFETVINSIVIE